MNDGFYDEVLKNPPQSHADVIFEDEANIIWVDWRENSEAIVEMISDKIHDSELVAEVLDAENDWGYEIAIKFGEATRTVAPAFDFDEQHLTMLAIDALVSPQYELRFVGDTNGSDTMGIVIETSSDWAKLYKKYGRRVNEHFCPIRELPDLMNTPGNEIDAAVANYAERIG